MPTGQGHGCLLTAPSEELTEGVPPENSDFNLDWLSPSPSLLHCLADLSTSFKASHEEPPLQRCHLFRGATSVSIFLGYTRRHGLYPHA